MEELPAVIWPKTVIALVAVAAFDIMMMLVPLVETTVVPAGMPGPEMAWPNITPLMLDAEVMDVLPEVRKPVIELEVLALDDKVTPMLVAVAGSDITMVPFGAVPLNETTVVPGCIPVCAEVMTWPAATPARLDTAVMFALPEVTWPVIGFKAVPLAVRVMMAGPLGMVLMVVLPGIPVPEMGWPTTSCPPMFASPVMFALPEATMPVSVLVLVPFALFDIVMVVPLAAVMVVPEGMPVPAEMGCPTSTRRGSTQPRWSCCPWRRCQL